MTRPKKPRWPLVYTDPFLQDRYEQLRAAGNSHSMSEILAEQRPPGLKGTERAFAQGRNGGQDIDTMCTGNRKKLLENAKKAGVSVQGKMYCGQLARRGVPCDPLALVGSLDEVKAKAAALGKYVNQEPPEVPPPKSVPLAESIVQREIARAIEKNPDLAHVPKANIREQVIDKHALKRKDRT